MAAAPACSRRCGFAPAGRDGSLAVVRNAVVNVSVLRHWNEFWRKLFLTVGILVAVFGMRLVFPLLIVSVATGLGLFDVWTMATTTPDEYSRHLTEAHAQVAAFGGAFLLLVFLNFLFDEDKEHHWLGWSRKTRSIRQRRWPCCAPVGVLAHTMVRERPAQRAERRLVGVVVYLAVSG